MQIKNDNPIEIYDTKIRRLFDKNSNKWLFSIVDVIDIAIKTSDPRNYWKVLKNRLIKTQIQLVTSCKPFKMEASDGKFYLTDTGSEETILKILNIVAEEKVPSFEAYFGSLSAPKSENILSLIQNKFEPLKPEVFALKHHIASYPQQNENNAERTINFDIYRCDNFLIAEAFVAGVYLSDLSITATINTLSITGHRDLQNNISKEDYAIQEIYWGGFSRTILLPLEVDINKIAAKDERGVLTITMPIIDKSYNRRLKVKSI